MLLLISIGNGENLQISDRAMVHAVAIDQSGDELTLTLQIFKPQGSGGDTPIDMNQANNFVISNTAPTVEQALTMTENQLGSRLFLGHNQVIVIGSAVSLENSSQLLSSFIGVKDSYLGVDVVLAENTASELLAVPLTAGADSAENFSEILKISRENGVCGSSDLLTLINGLEGEQHSAVLPVVAVKKSSAPQASGNESSEEQSQSENSTTETGSLLQVIGERTITTE